MPDAERTRPQDHPVCPEPGYPELLEQALEEQPHDKRIQNLSIQFPPWIVVGVDAYRGHTEGRKDLEA